MSVGQRLTRRDAAGERPPAHALTKRRTQVVVLGCSRPADERAGVYQFTALSPVQRLAILGYHVPLYNIAVMSADSSATLVANSLPMPLVFAAAMSSVVRDLRQ